MIGFEVDEEVEPGAGHSKRFEPLRVALSSDLGNACAWQRPEISAPVDWALAFGELDQPLRQLERRST